MRLLFKLPLLSVVGVLATQMTFSGRAIAGREPVIIPDSSTNGLGDTFAPTPPRVMTVEEIVNNSLNDIGQNSSVPSGSSQSLPITDQQVAAIRDAISAENPASLQQALSDLQQQLSNELGGPSINLARVDNSRASVQDAVEASNDLINSLNNQILEAGAESPTLTTLLELLEDANASLNSDPGLMFEDGEGEFGLIRVAPGVAQVVEPEEPEIIEERQEPIESEAESEVQQPAPQPIRGLW
ncbi:MAG: hypothetical protein WA949_09940 [Phormidesmis sp.]